jgi:RNA polymerase sigma-70 factor (ECF subfamily)
MDPRSRRQSSDLDLEALLAPVMEWCLKRTRDPHLSEDVVQDTAVIALTRLGTLRDPARLRGWLFRIARRKIATAMRERGRVEALRFEPFEESAPPDDRGRRDLLAASLRRTVRGLPTFLRRPLRLHYLKGEPLREIAARLETTVSSVKTRLYRARKALRQGGGR